MHSLPTFEAQSVQTVDALRRMEPAAGAVRLVLSPYRICPLGAHVDHQGGTVLGRTLATGTVLAYAPLSGPQVRLSSSHFGEIAFEIGQPPDLTHWARYAEAAALALGRSHPLRRGLAGVVSGTLIGAGVSSSASVGLAYLLALAEANDIALTPADLVELDYRLEHDFLGLQNGILDPATIVHGRPDAFVHIQTRTGAVTPVADPPAARDLAWLVIYSGVSRQLIGSGFNQRVAECREAAALLQPGAAILSDVPRETYLARRESLPPHLARRADHFFGEIARVEQGREAWARGDAAAFGDLMNQSCESSIHLYESGSRELVTLQRIARQTPGVHGSRFSGGGYGGCVVALVARDQAGAAGEAILERYAAAHPEQAGRAAAYLIESDGSLRSGHAT